MEKEYKFINDVYSYSVESQINTLAAEGWVVKSFNVSYKGENNDEETCFILLEYDNSDNYEEGIYERLGDVSDKLSRIIQKIDQLKDSEVVDKLDDIKDMLKFIESNTGN